MSTGFTPIGVAHPEAISASPASPRTHTVVGARRRRFAARPTLIMMSLLSSAVGSTKDADVSPHIASWGGHGSSGSAPGGSPGARAHCAAANACAGPNARSPGGAPGGSPGPAPTAPPPTPALVPTPRRAPREVAQASPPGLNGLLSALTRTNPPSTTTNKNTIRAFDISFFRVIIRMEESSFPSFFCLFRPDGSRCRSGCNFFGLCGNHKREQAIFQLWRGVPWGKQGGKLQPLGFPVRDEELAGYRGGAIFDPDLPIEILLVGKPSDDMVSPAPCSALDRSRQASPP